MTLPDRDFQHLEDLEQQFLERERTSGASSEELWRWSPLEFREFDYMLSLAVGLAKQERNLVTGEAYSFFEAGCGIGTKLALAQNGYGLAAFGWELVEEYLDQCKVLDVSAERHDLRYEDPGYEDYDIVYISQPFKDDATEVAWERRVHRAIRPGGILIAAFASVKPYTWECYYRQPWRGVWVKPKTAEQRPYSTQWEIR